MRTFTINTLLPLLCCLLTEPVYSEPLQEVMLRECPSSPNCVSTQSSDPAKHMNPLPYSGDIKETRQIILSIIASMPRTRVVTEKDHYIHAEFRSMIFRFVDDVEFLFDEENKQIHFRSASRTGYSDLGVNRKRMQKISRLYNNKIEGRSHQD